jgi:hypothetical protein
VFELTETELSWETVAMLACVVGLLVLFAAWKFCSALPPGARR